MSTEIIPYIKWGDYTSKDETNPDILDIKVSDLDTFETEYSVNVQILLKVEDKLECRNLPLKSHTSKNASLLNMWKKEVREKRIKKDARIKLETWLGESKNGFPIRRFNLNL